MQNEQAHEPFESIKPTKPATRMSRESKDDVDKIEIEVVIHRADESNSGEASQLRQAFPMRSIGKACIAILAMSAFFIATELAFGHDAIHNDRDLFAAKPPSPPNQSGAAAQPSEAMSATADVHHRKGGLLLFVLHPGDSTPIGLTFPADATVGDVARLAAVNPAEFVLSFAGEQLKDPSLPLSDAGIGQEALVEFVRGPIVVDSPEPKTIPAIRAGESIIVRWTPNTQLRCHMTKGNATVRVHVQGFEPLTIPRHEDYAELIIDLPGKRVLFGRFDDWAIPYELAPIPQGSAIEVTSYSADIEFAEAGAEVQIRLK